MDIKIERYRETSYSSKIKGNLSITIMIGDIPFSVNDVKHIETDDGGHFYALPSRSYTSNEGETKYIAINGFFRKGDGAVFNKAMDEAMLAFNANNQRQENESYQRAAPAPEPDRSEDLPF